MLWQNNGEDITMIISEKEEWQEFLDWFDEHRNKLPEWINKNMSLHDCKLLWEEKVKNDKRRKEC